jgi:hypothetical protein
MVKETDDKYLVIKNDWNWTDKRFIIEINDVEYLVYKSDILKAIQNATNV